MSNTREIPELNGVEIEQNPWFLTSIHQLPTKAPLIGVHGATHHGLAQAIGRGHEDHVFEAALRV